MLLLGDDGETVSAGNNDGGSPDRERNTSGVCTLNKLGHTLEVDYPLPTPNNLFPHIEATFQHPECSTHTRGDHHRQSSQMVELRKKYRLTDENIDMEVTDKHILKIYSRLENWKRVAAHLGLTRADIQAIESGARPDEELMRLYMLQEWKSKKRFNGEITYQFLLEALIECNCSESAFQVCELLKSCNTPLHTMPHYST